VKADLHFEYYFSFELMSMQMKAILALKKAKGKRSSCDFE